MAHASRSASSTLLCTIVIVATLIGRPAHAQTQPVILYSCTDITQPGVYQLGQSIVGSTTGQSCVQVHSSGPVTLDCQQFLLGTADFAPGALLIQNSQNFTVQNCPIGSTTAYAGSELEIENSSNGTVQNNTFLGAQGPTDAVNVYVHSSDSITFTDNTFFVTYFQQYTTNSKMTNNSISCGSTTGSVCGVGIESEYGFGNLISGNTVNGNTSADQLTQLSGADDGILIWDEDGDSVEGNTVSNVYDCGIEFVGNVGAGTFSNNTINNASLCGLGGWWWSNFQNNVVHGNTVNGSTNLFTFVRDCGLRPTNFDGQGHPGDSGIYFTGNTFDGNSITNIYPTSYAGISNGYSSFIPFGPQNLDINQSPSTCNGDIPPAPGQFYLTGNSFSNNNFGSSIAYFGEPAYPGAVVDQGGNVCVETQYADYPLACGVPPCGTQWNPWHPLSTNLLVRAAHQNQYAERTVNGTCEMGIYDRPYTWNGTTMYIWVYQSGLACPVPDGTCPSPP